MLDRKPSPFNAPRQIAITDKIATPILTKPSSDTLRREFLAHHLGDAASDWRLTPVGRARINSSVYRADSRASGRRVLLKQTLPPTGDSFLDSHGAQAQFIALSEAARVLGDHAECQVPAALACDPAAGLMAIKWIDAPLASAALACAKTEAAASTIAQRCGRWLALYHAASGSVRLDTVNLLSHLAQARGVRSVPQHLATTIRRLELNATRAATFDLPTGWMHGDFKSANLLLTKSATYGIDLAPRRVNLVLPDLAMYLNHAALSGVASRWPGAERAFLAGYLGPRSDFPQMALDWLRVQMLAERLLEASAPRRLATTLLPALNSEFRLMTQLAHRLG